MPPLKLSCIPLIYYREMVQERTMSVLDWLRVAAGLGLDAVELTHSVLEPYLPEELSALRRELDRLGLRVDQICNTGDFVNPSPAVRNEALLTLRQQIEAAALLGASSLRVTAGQIQPGLTLDAAIRRFLAGVEPCFEPAARAGVELLLENHYKYVYWERPDITFRTENFLAFAEALRGTPVRINFDCANQIMAGEDPLPVLEAVKDRVAHVHINDRATPGQYQHSVVGEGVTPLRQMLATLLRAGFDGFVSLEYNGTEGLDGMTRSLAAVRRLWREACQDAGELPDLAGALAAP